MKKYLLFLFLIPVFYGSQAQTDGVQIDYSVTPPARNNSAIFELNSITQGFLPPRMTYAEEQAIVAPVEGLIVYNTTSDCIDLYTGGFWQSIYCGCPNLPALGAITGPEPVCAGTTVAYTVPAVTGASSYTWTVTGVLPANITGNGSNAISFIAPTINQYTVSVVAANACGTSTVNQSSIIDTYTAVPNTPAWVTTPTDVCTESTFNYSVVNQLGANGLGVITYTWTITATGGATATITANSATASAGTPAPIHQMQPVLP